MAKSTKSRTELIASDVVDANDNSRIQDAQAVEETNGATTSKKPVRKTTCPMNYSEFEEHATPLTITVDGMTFVADLKQFASGSFGWFMNGKAPITVNGKRLSVQIGLNLTVIGSKDLA